MPKIGEYFSRHELLKRLRDVVKSRGSQSSAARSLGISYQYLNDILQDRRPLGPKAVAALGFSEAFTEKRPP